MWSVPSVSSRWVLRVVTLRTPLSYSCTLNTATQTHAPSMLSTSLSSDETRHSDEPRCSKMLLVAECTETLYALTSKMESLTPEHSTTYGAMVTAMMPATLGSDGHPLLYCFFTFLQSWTDSGPRAIFAICACSRFRNLAGMHAKLRCAMCPAAHNYLRCPFTPTIHKP